jgi:hypothetical protein
MKLRLVSARVKRVITSQLQFGSEPAAPKNDLVAKLDSAAQSFVRSPQADNYVTY